MAKFAKLKIKDEEGDEYLKNLEEILDFTNMLNTANTEGMEETIAANEKKNVFRNDNAITFEDNQSLLQYAAETERNMYKILKVIN